MSNNIYKRSVKEIAIIDNKTIEKHLEYLNTYLENNSYSPILTTILYELIQHFENDTELENIFKNRSHNPKLLEYFLAISYEYYLIGDNDYISICRLTTLAINDGLVTYLHNNNIPVNIKFCHDIHNQFIEEDFVLPFEDRAMIDKFISSLQILKS